jgi:hypothetical protein
MHCFHAPSLPTAHPPSPPPAHPPRPPPRMLSQAAILVFSGSRGIRCGASDMWRIHYVDAPSAPTAHPPRPPPRIHLAPHSACSPKQPLLHHPRLLRQSGHEGWGKGHVAGRWGFGALFSPVFTLSSLYVASRLLVALDAPFSVGSHLIRCAPRSELVGAVTWTSVHSLFLPPRAISSLPNPVPNSREKKIRIIPIRRTVLFQGDAEIVQSTGVTGTSFHFNSDGTLLN